MKKTILVLLSIMTFVTANAKKNDPALNNNNENSSPETEIIGAVVDEYSRESLVGVEVVIEGTGMKTYTDIDGNFSFNNIKLGEYKLSVNYISYETLVKVLNVTPNQTEVLITLQPVN